MPNFENVPTKQLKELIKTIGKELLKRAECDKTESILHAASMMNIFELSDISEQLGYDDKRKIGAVLRLSGYETAVIWDAQKRKPIRRWRKK